jgi:glycosyltransferase involved in cell wall biosynthesis
MPETRVIFLVEGEPRRGLSPAARLRAYQYGPLFRQAGRDCVFLPSRPPKYFHNRYRLKQLRARARWLYRLIVFCGWTLIFVTRICQLLCIRSGDVVLLQRDLLPNASVALEKLLARRTRRLIFDFDDALLEQNMGKIQTILRLAHHVIVATPQLETQVKPLNTNVHVIATPVDTATIRPAARRSNTPPVVGWIGTSSNLVFLKPLEDMFRALALVRSFRLRLVCNRALASEYPNLPASLMEIAEWRLECETEQLQAFDIGIMPLRDDLWCRGKAGFKLLQYMAAGLPVVASPIGYNRTLVQPGINGFLADSSEEWLQALSRLLTDDPLRRQLGKRGRELVEKEFSLPASFAKLLNVIDAA